MKKMKTITVNTMRDLYDFVERPDVTVLNSLKVAEAFTGFKVEVLGDTSTITKSELLKHLQWLEKEPEKAFLKIIDLG